MANFQALKIFKQMYPATYNFKDDAVGAFPDGWVDNSGGTCTAEIIQAIGGHRKVLELDVVSANEAWAYNIFSNAPSGTVEAWIRTTDVTKRSRVFFLSDNLSSTSLIYFDSSKIRIHNGGFIDCLDPAVNNTTYHLRITFECGAGGHDGLAADTFNVYIDGIKTNSDIAFSNAVDNVNRLDCRAGDGANTGYQTYVDAIGYSWDTDYNIGDNVFWRHFKESTDDFESDDVGTQGTSITWVDNVNNADDHELIPEFNEHKKILRTYQNSGAGDCYHTFASQSTAGWVASWVKVADANAINGIVLLGEDANIRIKVQIDNDRFEYDAGAGMITAGVAAVDSTWYFVYLQWYADNTFDLWVNNVQYLDGVSTFANFTGSGVNRWYIDQDTAGAKYIYHDAPMSSLDSDVRADNRTFDYLPYTYNDITADINLCLVNEIAYQPSTATIRGSTALSIDTNHIIELYDENNDLRFQGDFTREIKPSLISEFPLISLNDDDLEDENSYTATSAEDVNASLLSIFTNVDQTTGRLIYYTEDDPAGNLTPNFKNKPIYRIIKDLAIHGGKYGIIRPNGVILLDDDRNPSNGAATISESTGEVMDNALIDDINFQFNYVEVRGAIDPSTGAPFFGISQDIDAQTLSGFKPYYKRYRELQSNTDCENRAIAIRTGTGFEPTIVQVTLKSIYALPGEIINFAYSHKSYSAANHFVEQASYNLVIGVCRYRLNTGIFDKLMINERGYDSSNETADDVNQTLFETDLVPIPLRLMPNLTATIDPTTGRIVLDAVFDAAIGTFYTDEKIDATRGMVITWTAKRIDANGGNFTVDKILYSGDTDGTEGDTDNSYTDLDFEFACPTQNKLYKLEWVIPAAEVVADREYNAYLVDDEGGDIIHVSQATVRYYIKRTV